MNNMSFPVTMSNDFKVEVATTNNRGSTPEEVAHRCVNKIVSVSENAHPTLRAQTIEYRNEVEKVIAVYMRQAIQSDRTTVYNAIKDAGQPTLAEHIRKM
jgi:hypothetical protein